MMSFSSSIVGCATQYSGADSGSLSPDSGMAARTKPQTDVSYKQN